MPARTYALPLVVSLALAAVSVVGQVPSARADEAGDPQKGQFTLAEATKGIAGPAGAPLMATIETNKGKLTCELFEKQTPITVANFVGLATGKRAWLDPKTSKWVKKPFYNGLTFHRVIPDFMIQGGDPLGTGIGNPGYQFNDEIADELKFDKPGLLAMANAGKRPDGSGTNGSQFFVTESMPAYLNGRHTIFGKCDPLQVVKDIARVPVGANDKPNEPVVMKKVTIARVKAKPAPAAKAGAPAGAPAAGAKAADKGGGEAPAAAAAPKPPAEKSAP